MENEFIKVLWVEDDPFVTQSYPMEAEDYSLELVPFRCWREAEAALRENFSQWDAVILDAKCKLESDSPDNAVSFLLNAQTSLVSICKEKNRHINYYILSGGAENEINDCILDTNVRYWDKDMHKKYYSKETDREILFRRIRAHMRESQHYQIRSMFYKPVFDAIATAGLDPDLNVIMEDLLGPIHFGGVNDMDYNNRMKDVRRGLEYIYRSMIVHGILPPEIRVVKGQKDNIKLEWASKILNGKEVPEINAYPKKSVCSPIMSKCIWTMTDTVGSNVHTTDTETAPGSIYTYLNDVNGSSYLIRSFSLQLCDMILWYSGYLRQHPDTGHNAANWKND